MSDGTFEPAKFLTRVNGSEYLEVKWRLVWLRDRHPHSQVETELIEHRGGWALFRARVTAVDEGGVLRGSATGWGQESEGDFRDYLEKAETKAIGRALAALGFGTQFCSDHEFGAAAGRVVDQPVRRPDCNPAAAATRPIERPPRGEVRPALPAPGRTQRVDDLPATQRQINFLEAVAREAGVDKQDLSAASMREFGVDYPQLNRRDCAALIDCYKPEPADAR